MPTDHDTVIADLKTEVQAFCEARDWDQFHGAKDLSIAIATEASELLELFHFIEDTTHNQIAEKLRTAFFGRPCRRASTGSTSSATMRRSTPTIRRPDPPSDRRASLSAPPPRLR